MPGLFGSLNAPKLASNTLRHEFLQCWSEATFEERGSVLIGGHAFAPHQALFDGPTSGLMIAVDGEWSLYEEAARHLPGSPQRLVRFERRSAGLETQCVGTVAVADSDKRSLILATDPTGTFPVYLCEHADGLLYSSLLRPLARAVRAEPDQVAALEFLRQAYIVGDKTLFHGIRRLLPGQVATYFDGHLVILDRSEAWVGTEQLTRSAAADLAWDRLVQSLQRAIPATDASLMMSGGWDSRTLLAVASAASRDIRCYSHGDVASRELRIVQSLSRDAGVECHLEAINERVLDPSLLDVGFQRTENVVFPHWHRSGRLLAEEGAKCVFAGVYGEILGGHYGPPMLMSSSTSKIASVASLLLFGRTFLKNGSDRNAALAALRVPALSHHWYLHRDYEMSIQDPLTRMNEDIHEGLARLTRRGVVQPAALVEAFISEHRGTQYINAQLRSVRASVDVCAPFARGEIFTLATRIPIRAKIHNSLNRRMLARNVPLLLTQPMAATLVPASAPILVQEASRAVRKGLEGTRGVDDRRNTGWVNFEFLRGGGELRALIDNLRTELWDKEAMHQMIDRIKGDPGKAMHPMFDQLGKILTVDLMLQ